MIFDEHEDVVTYEEHGFSTSQHSPTNRGSQGESYVQNFNITLGIRHGQFEVAKPKSIFKHRKKKAEVSNFDKIFYYSILIMLAGFSGVFRH